MYLWLLIHVILPVQLTWWVFFDGLTWGPRTWNDSTPGEAWGRMLTSSLGSPGGFPVGSPWFLRRSHRHHQVIDASSIELGDGGSSQPAGSQRWIVDIVVDKPQASISQWKNKHYIYIYIDTFLTGTGELSNSRQPLIAVCCSERLERFAASHVFEPPALARRWHHFSLRF